jgi:hypothetical protein
LGGVDVDVNNAAPIAVTQQGLQAALVPSSTGGAFSLGDGPFDGTSAGHFAGVVQGTYHATNAASGFTGLLRDTQVAGVRKERLDGNGNLFVSGGLGVGIIAKAVNYTATLADSVIFVTAGSVTITLPSASSAGAGRMFTVKNIATSAATTVATAGGTIDGAATATVPLGYGVVRVVSSGAAYYII